MKTYKNYRERVLFLCRDWTPLPNESQIKNMWKWYSALMNNNR